MAPPELVNTPEGLALTDGTMSIRGDFSHMKRRLRPNNVARELLVRAAKIKGVDHPTAIDATAGLGEDSILLAAAGFEVTMFERNETIAALLRDAMDRAMRDEELSAAIGHMRLVEGDSISLLASLEQAPHVIFLDPMFPAKTKDSAVKKKLQLFQMLESPCEDERALLDAALGTGAKKVVVKRPLKGPYLANAKPSYDLRGKAIRYDCYVQ